MWLDLLGIPSSVKETLILNPWEKTVKHPPFVIFLLKSYRVEDDVSNILG